ncbi:hypothetical protein COOONC_06286 [Cooperia oncophora]
MPQVEIKREIVRILGKNKRLFQEGIGRCTTARAELKFKSEVVTPKFFRARPVPIALRPKVEAKLEEMVRNGIIRRVEHSKWATPLVVVPKPGGKIRICGDYKVTNRLNEAGFRLKREKCEFFKEEMEFLGHVVDEKGIRPSPNKLKAILNMPEPRNLKELESYLGMIQYYGKFIPRLATLAAPLNGLRRKNAPWKWGAQEKAAFSQIREKLTAADTLAHYNPDIPVVLATDASEYGIGAVLYHRYEDGTEKVIAYASRSLTKQERNYAQIEKEALGIVYGVEKFNQFLYGRRFTLLTDHQPLVRIFGPKQGLPVIAAKRLHRWALRLMLYSFEIEYRKTTDFGNADGLSRLPDPRELPSSEMVVNELQVQQMAEEAMENLPVVEEEIAKATREDPLLQTVVNYMQKGWPMKVKDDKLKPYAVKKTALSLHNGCLLWGNRVVIPKKFQPVV